MDVVKVVECFNFMRTGEKILVQLDMVFLVLEIGVKYWQYSLFNDIVSGIISKFNQSIMKQ